MKKIVVINNHSFQEALGLDVAGPECSAIEVEVGENNYKFGSWESVNKWLNENPENRKRTEETKAKVAKITKDYWDSPEALTRKAELVERNKTIHSQQMKDRWADPTEAMLNRVIPGRPKGSKETKPRKRKGGYKRRSKAEMLNDQARNFR